MRRDIHGATRDTTVPGDVASIASARRPRRGRRKDLGRALAAGLLALSSGCGGDSDGPVGPSTPPPPATTPGGVVRGGYVFRIAPGPGSCSAGWPPPCCPALRPSYSFFVEANPDDRGTRPGVQVVATGFDADFSLTGVLFEMELIYQSPNLLGGAGVVYSGVPTQEGVQIWIRGVASGAVASTSLGPGEVAQGTLIADLAYGSAAGDDAEGNLGTCFSTAHRWSLTIS